MKHFKLKTQAAVMAILASMLTVSSTVAESNGYEIWGSDQSNSVSNVDSRGRERQLALDLGQQRC